MKKTGLLFALLLTFFSAFRPGKTNAQVTGMTVHFADSMFSTLCVLPQNAYFLISGTLTGTITPACDTISMYINWDDGSDTTLLFPTYPGGSSGTNYNYYPTHTYNLPGTYTPYVTTTAVGGVTASHTALPVTLTNLCSTVTGQLYVDANSNCTSDPGETGIDGVPVFVVSGVDTTIGTWTDAAGDYALLLNPGTYTIIVPSAAASYSSYWSYTGPLSPTCPASGTYLLTVAPTSSYTVNFAYACATVTDIDMSANVWDWKLVRGDTTTLEVWSADWYWMWDYTCMSLSSTITLTLDPHVHYAGYYPALSYGPAPTVSGSTITWTVGTTASDIFDFDQLLKVYVDTFTYLGETLCNTIHATPTSYPDPNLANNTMTFCSPVLASYDPNGMAVAPQGVGAQGYIPNNTPLTYEIHFQNTGTAPANNIVLQDTFSTNVDVTTLHVLKSTAPVEVYNVGNAFTFRFSNINLPDSASNPDASIGSVVVGVMPKQGLAEGTQIYNRAGIYFDYNPPVSTNSVLNTINSTLNVSHVANAGIKADVYPNPANEQIAVKTDGTAEYNVALMDMLGRSLTTGHSTDRNAVISTRNIPEGFYIVRINDEKGNEVTAKVVVKH